MNLHEFIWVQTTHQSCRDKRKCAHFFYCIWRKRVWRRNSIDYHSRRESLMMICLREETWSDFWTRDGEGVSIQKDRRIRTDSSETDEINVLLFFILLHILWISNLNRKDTDERERERCSRQEAPFLCSSLFFSSSFPQKNLLLCFSLGNKLKTWR